MSEKPLIRYIRLFIINHYHYHKHFLLKKQENHKLNVYKFSKKPVYITADYSIFKFSPFTVNCTVTFPIHSFFPGRPTGLIMEGSPLSR